jgi:hypothetical protein
MKAAVYHKPTDLAVEERDVYDIRDDEVLKRVPHRSAALI